MLHTIAFDADDTLWHNETHYTRAKQAFGALLAHHAAPQQAILRLDEIENANVALYGYGIKSFTLSMIETALELAHGALTGTDLSAILAVGREMLTHNVILFEHAAEMLAALAQRYPLMLITKGDTAEQSAKIERSGLADYFRIIEIVGDKTPAVYRALLERHYLRPEGFLMVGNSLKSDILPVLEIGGRAVYIPYAHTWAHEHVAAADAARDGYVEIEHLGLLPALVERLSGE